MEDPLDQILTGRDFGGVMRNGELLRAPSGSGGGKGGGGGKKGSSGGFTEDPNTMQSDAVFTAVDALCEGPIVGLWYGLQSVFLNNVPLYDPRGFRNFTGVVIDVRNGYPDQPYLVGMNVVEQPVVVNQRFTNGLQQTGDATLKGLPVDPFTFEVGQALGVGVVNPDMIGITIQVNGLTRMDLKRNELKGNSVAFSIWCQGSDMSDFGQVGVDSINGKTTAPYQRSYVLSPAGAPPWTFQVRRESADFTKSTEVGDTYVFSYSLIYDKKLTYMNTALVGALIDASQFGSALPTRSYDILGLIVDVPSNYDPYARTYDGFWDGTFVQKWTNNPAWVVYALLTNKRWGLGKRIDQSMVDKWALYTVGKFCDERVPNMAGGTEPRFTFDGIITGQQDAYAVINQVASCFRGMVYWGANGITFSQDAPTGYDENQTPYSSPVAIFSPANVVDGDFTYEGTAEKARHSIVLVTFNDPRNNFKAGIEPVEVPALIKRYGQRVLRVTAYGCTRRSQAHRYGKWILASEQLETETVTFTTGLEYADLTPGSVIGVADPHRESLAMAGRIVSATFGSITVDRIFGVDFVGGGYSIVFQSPTNEGVIRRNITNAAVTADGKNQILSTHSILGTTNDTPVSGALFLISYTGLVDEESSTGLMRLFRVISNKELKPTQYQIVAVEHNPSKFSEVDNDEPLVDTGGTPLGSWPVGAPRSFQAVNNIYLVLGVPRVDITLSWQPPVSPNAADLSGTNDPRVVGYQVFKRVNNVYELVTTTTSLSTTITNVAEDDYFFAVRAITPIMAGPYSTLEDNTVPAGFGVPADITGLAANVSYNDATIFWVESPSPGVTGYHVYRDNVSFSITTFGDDSCYVRFSDLGNHTYKVFAETATGEVSANSPSLVFNPLTPPDPVGFSITSIVGNVVTFGWTGAPPPGTFYVIRYGTDWNSSTPLVSGIVMTGPVAIDFGSDPTGVVFWCRTESNIGKFSNGIISSDGDVSTELEPFTNVGIIPSVVRTIGKSYHGEVDVVPSAGKVITLNPFIVDIGVTPSGVPTRNIVDIMVDVSFVPTASTPRLLAQSILANVTIDGSLSKTTLLTLLTNAGVIPSQGTRENFLVSVDVVPTGTEVRVIDFMVDESFIGIGGDFRIMEGGDSHIVED